MLSRFFVPFFIIGCLALAVAGELYISKALLNDVKKMYGEQAGKRVLAWQDIMLNSKGLSDQQKMEKVNRFFNQLEFISDIKHWGMEDFWATPVEFLASGGGDCEDFSIAKYYTLRELGIPDRKLRITYVEALELNQAHMVLSYYSRPNSEPLILDNLKGEILPAKQRKDLKPVYNFNGDGLWVAKQRGKGVRVGKADRLTLWVDLRKRFKASVESGKASTR